MKHPVAAGGPVPDIVCGIVRSGEHGVPSAGRFSDECFALAESLDILGSDEGAAELAVDTALWGYQEIRTRPFYWHDKRKLLTRIMRTTNIALFRERKTGHPSAAALAVALVGPKTCWVSAVGGVAVYLYDARSVGQLVWPAPLRHAGAVGIGLTRYAEPPQTFSCPFLAGYAIIMLSSRAAATVSTAAVEAIFRSAGTSDAQVSVDVASSLKRCGGGSGSAGAAAVLIRRVGKG